MSGGGGALGSRGSLVVEYVLLLSVGVAVALLMVNLLLSREQGDEGIIIKKWQQVLELIAED